MHKIDGAGNVSGAFTEGTPGVQEATVLTADWCNAVQTELVNAIEDMGGVLSKPDNTQLETGLRATYGAKGTTNTWELAQTFQGNVTIQSTGALDVDGNTTLGTNAANTQTFNGVSTFNGAATFSENTSFAAGKTATFSGTVTMTAATVTTGAISTGAITTSGNTAMTGASPASTTAISNTVTPKNIAKAWATISISGGTATLVDGFNIASVAIEGIYVLVTLASAFTSEDYAVFVSTRTSGATFYYVDGPSTGSMTTQFRIGGINTSGTGVDLSSGSRRLYAVCFGAQ